MGGFVAEEMLFPVAFARLWLRARRRRKTREEKRCVLWSIALSLSSTIIRSVRGGTAPSPSVAAADGANAAECVLNRFRLRSGGTSIELNWIELNWILFIHSIRCFVSAVGNSSSGGDLSFIGNAAWSAQESKLLYCLPGWNLRISGDVYWFVLEFVCYWLLDFPIYQW